MTKNQLQSAHWKKLFVAWSLLLNLALAAFMVWMLAFHTEPSFFTIAVVETAIMEIGLITLYIRASINIWQFRPYAKKSALFLVIWWSIVFAFILIAGLLPSESNDEYASIRYAASLSIIGAITIIQMVFLRKISYGDTDA